MSGILDSKVIIVLGTDEIGAGIARRLAREGARVAVMDHDAGRASDVGAELANEGAEAFATKVDYSSAASIAAAVAQVVTQCGNVYALINNVLPVPTPAPLELQTGAMFYDAFARVRTAVSAMQAVVPSMREAGRGTDRQCGPSLRRKRE